MSHPSGGASTRTSAFHALRYPAFRRLCLASYLDAAGTWMERLAVGWFILDTTGSVFLAALSFAARSAPNMLLGPLGGAVADRFARPRVLMATTAMKSLLMCALALVGFRGAESATPVLLVVAAAAFARASEQPTVQGLIGDIVGTDRLGAGTGLHATGTRVVGLFASLAAGLLLDAAGPGPVFLCAAVASGIASAVFAGLHVPNAVVGTSARRSLLGDTVEGFRVASRIPVVVLLLVLAVAVEVFAFSYQSLLPALADRVLSVGATGLGVLTFGASLGGVLGMLALTRLVEAVPRGRLLVAVTGVFAVSLLGLALSDRFAVSVGLIVLVGAMAGMFDGLQWVLLQSSVPEGVRGRVIGLWMMAIGFGWLGPVMLGAAAEAVGTQRALAVGALVALAAAGAALASPALRRV